MNDLRVTEEDLAGYRNNKDIIGKTALQVIKDFGIYGYEIILPTDLCFAYDDLFAQLSPIIHELLNINISRLYSLLYAIDIGENKIKHSLNEMDNIPPHEIITHLILNRELLKVLTREYFRRKS
jgi:hypothetical protein